MQRSHSSEARYSHSSEARYSHSGEAQQQQSSKARQQQSNTQQCSELCQVSSMQHCCDVKRGLPARHSSPSICKSALKVVFFHIGEVTCHFFGHFVLCPLLVLDGCSWLQVGAAHKHAILPQVGTIIAALSHACHFSLLQYIVDCIVHFCMLNHCNRHSSVSA